MANAVQWTVDQFYTQLQALKSQIDSVAATLDADRSRLSQLYDTARRNMDPARDAYLEPLIHQNTVLRLQYLAPIRAKFNEAVSATSKLLRSGGYSTPTLSGLELGVLPIVPVVAVSAVLLALAAVAVLYRLTQSQVANTNAMAAIMGDRTTTADQKLALAKAITDQTKQQRQANPPLFDPNAFVLPLAIIAAIVLGPQLLRAFPRRAAA